MGQVGRFQRLSCMVDERQAVQCGGQRQFLRPITRLFTASSHEKYELILPTCILTVLIFILSMYRSATAGKVESNRRLAESEKLVTLALIGNCSITAMKGFVWMLTGSSGE